MKNDMKTKEKIKQLFLNAKVRHVLSIGIMSVCCLFIMLFVISVLPSMAVETEVEVPAFVPTTIPEETTVEISTEAPTEAPTEPETIKVDKSKTKVDKKVTASVATGNAKKDEDSGAKKVLDSSTSDSKEEIVAPPPAVETPVQDVVSDVTDFTYAATENLTGLQKVGSDVFYFNDNHELVKGHQLMNGLRYYYNDYGARASLCGIDVSYHNGTIDWAKVKASGIDYAIIRVGFRGYGSAGTMRVDREFYNNINGATQNGIKVGLYFYSQATNVDEAVEEASLAVNTLGGRSLQYPIYFDTEYATSDRTGRADKISKSVRTACAVAFCETVKSAGYKAGIYASKAFYDDELIFLQLSSYNIWVAHYSSKVTDFRHPYKMWQYSSKGEIKGIKNYVDLNISLYDYAKDSDMKKCGENVIFIGTAAEIIPFENAEKAVTDYENLKTDEAYQNALDIINNLNNDRVKNSLLQKLNKIKDTVTTEKITG